MALPQKRSLFIAITAVAVQMFCIVAAMGITVCGKCGYENEADAGECTHCGSALARQELVSPDAATNRQVKAVGNTADNVLPALDKRLGLEYLRKGDFCLARLFFLNALALHALAPDVQGSSSSRDIADALAQCSRKASATPVTLLLKMAGEANRGYLEAQKARGYRQIGEAWCPAVVAEALDFDSRLVLMRSAGMQCRACLGTGLGICPGCKGQGRVRCSAEGCRDGMVTLDKAASLVKDGAALRVKCRTCNATGWGGCHACAGRGGMPCESCSGTGMAPLCDTCAGEGVVACRRCGGSGKARGGAECTACDGNGRVPCKTCKGIGRRK